MDIVNDDDDNDGLGTTKQENASEKVFPAGIGIDINLPHQTDLDDEIADVDVSDDVERKVGRNAAEALRAQVNAEGKEQTSSSSSTVEVRVAVVGVEVEVEVEVGAVVVIVKAVMVTQSSLFKWLESCRFT